VESDVLEALRADDLGQLERVVESGEDLVVPVAVVATPDGRQVDCQPLVEIGGDRVLELPWDGCHELVEDELLRHAIEGEHREHRVAELQEQRAARLEER
jgi:hypothetical protein